MKRKKYLEWLPAAALLTAAVCFLVSCRMPDGSFPPESDGSTASESVISDAWGIDPSVFSDTASVCPPPPFSSDEEGVSSDESAASSDENSSSDEEKASSDVEDTSSGSLPPEIVSQPVSLTVPRGGSVKISVKAKGKGLKYKWYFKKDGKGSFSARKGFTHASETVRHDGKWEKLLYYCTVTDSSGNTAASETASITLEKVMRILAVGDSICRGGRNSHKGFVGDLGLPYLNLGQNGATLSTKETSVTNIPQQLAEVDDYKPDIIIADGGVNDYIYSVPLGTVPKKPVSDPRRLSDDTLATAMGGLQRLFALMKSKFPEAKRYFVITHKTTQRLPTKVNGKYIFTEKDRYIDWTVTPNKAGYTQQELHDATVACCKIYGVEVIDIYKNSSLNTADSQYCSSTSFNDDPSVTDREYVDIDGVHPLDRGYLKCYVPLIARKIKAARQSAVIPLEIIRQPKSTTVSPGDAITVSLKASGTGLQYQWYFKKQGQTDFSEWKNRTHDSETVTPNDTWNGIQLYCLVTDKSGKSLRSDVITVSFR